MNHKLAQKILGVRDETPLRDIQKKYRELMILTHPDMMLNHGYPFDAADINAAYEYLMKNGKVVDVVEMEDDANINLWNAPMNDNAYAKRGILTYVEDSFGEIHGNIQVAEGKYIWTKDEEFPLFLLSLYNCSKKIVDDAQVKIKKVYPDDIKEKLHKEIAYLLAGQFVDPYIILEEYLQDNIYIIPAMVEYTGSVTCKTNEIIYPKSIKDHRLILQNKERKEIGYLSFKDDRLYYCLIPFFDARRVMIKMKITSENVRKARMKKYSELELDVIFTDEEPGTMIDSINIKIDNLIQIANDRCK